MSPNEFVLCLRTEVLEQNLELYRESLERQGTLKTEIRAPWPRLTELYQSLTEEQQRELIQGIRQVIVDTLSNVLGILDGSTLLEKYRDYFHLTYGDDPKELNGELQDMFLSPESRKSGNTGG